MQKFFQVIEEYNPKKDYRIKIRPQYCKILSELKLGQRINPKEFIQNNLNKFTRKKSFETNRHAVYHALNVGKKIGVLKSLSNEEAHTTPISLENFCKLETVTYFTDQLRGSRYQNINQDKKTGTAYTYSYHLWRFNNWLCGREFEFTGEIQTGIDSFKRKKIKTKLKGVEHLLKLYQKSYNSKADFIRIIKQYLLDPVFKNNRAKYMKLIYSAIISYFEKNDAIPLNFSFNFKARHKFATDEDEQPILTLENLLDLLTVGKPSLVQKAVFLCKFHRCLDTSTLVDRFNFQAWDQLAEYFGTSDHTKWDLTKCPVPIKLTRMKVDYSHTGFLDIDAVDAIQKYLDYRKKHIVFRDIKPRESLFLTEKRRPINNVWVTSSFKKLCKNASLDKPLKGYEQTRYMINTHEFRDLFKSTLIESGVREDLVEHYMGHKPRDSYEKQAVIFSETLRTEFMKASDKLNIFSNISNYMKGGTKDSRVKLEKEKHEKKQLEDKIRQLEQKQTKLEKNQEGYRELKSIVDEYLKEHFEDLFNKIEFEKISSFKNKSLTA